MTFRTDKNVCLDVSRVGISLNDVGERCAFYGMQGLWVEFLIFKIVPISIAQGCELIGDDCTERGTDGGAG